MHTCSTEQALTLIQSKAGGKNLPSLLTVSGGTCSGKTYFSHRLTEALQSIGLSVSTLSLDDYFRDVDDPKLYRNRNGNAIFDHPSSYDVSEFVKHACLLRNGNSISSPIYNISENKRLQEQFKKIGPADFIIAEGLYAGRFLKDYQGFNIFVDTDQKTCLERRIASDTVLYGVSRTQVETFFREKVLPYWETFIDSQKGFAHLIVTN